MRSRILAAWIAALLPAAGARAAEPLDVELGRDGTTALVAGGIAIALGHFSASLTPRTCRFCEPDKFDAWGRDRLRWENPLKAAQASDLLANGLLPAAVVAHALGAGWLAGGGLADGGQDLLAIGEAALISVDLNEGVKGTVGRLRPSAWAAGEVSGVNGNRSFYSGHTAFAFSLASAAGTVATLRGYRSAPWVWAVGMTLAAGVGYLRVAGDAHWATDVLAGAAIGGAVGFGVPYVLHRRRRRGEPPIQLSPAPGGFALQF